MIYSTLILSIFKDKDTFNLQYGNKKNWLLLGRTLFEIFENFEIIQKISPNFQSAKMVALPNFLIDKQITLNSLKV